MRYCRQRLAPITTSLPDCPKAYYQSQSILAIPPVLHDCQTSPALSSSCKPSYHHAPSTARHSQQPARLSSFRDPSTFLWAHQAQLSARSRPIPAANQSAMPASSASVVTHIKPSPPNQQVPPSQFFTTSINNHIHQQSHPSTPQTIQ